ncbi:MAG: hypothetical protein ABH952_01010 [Candidatus Omnitrophota bacterium]
MRSLSTHLSPALKINDADFVERVRGAVSENSILGEDKGNLNELRVSPETFSILSDILSIDLATAESICKIIIAFNQPNIDVGTFKDELSDMILPQGNYILKQIYLPEHRRHVSILGHNNTVVRFIGENGALKIIEMTAPHRRNADYSDRELLSKLSQHMSDVALQLSDESGLTSEELNNAFWTIPEDKVIKGADGKPRALELDEMVVILQDTRIRLERDNTASEWRQDNDLDRILSIDPKVGIVWRRNIELRVGEHQYLFNALPREPNELRVYLARDALSALEYDIYLQRFSGTDYPRAIVYQPGLPYYFNYSIYTYNQRLEHAQNIIREIFLNVKRELNIDTLGTEDKQDESEFNPVLYREFYKRFKSKVIEKLESDQGFREEAEFLYRQMGRHGISNYRKVRVIDLNATGKTIYYVMAVLDYFSEQAGQPLEANGFVGFGRGEMVGLPKIKHNQPDINARFTDVQ